MGWDVTDYFDVAVKEAFKIVDHLSVGIDDSERIDIMRPFVAQLATTYRAEDWDTYEESDFFQMFPKEIAPDDEADWSWPDYWWDKEDK